MLVKTLLLLSSISPPEITAGLPVPYLIYISCQSLLIYVLLDIITGDGGPQTFSRVEDTNIPALRDYLMQLAQPRSEKGINKLLQLVDMLHTSLLQYLDTANTDEEHRLQKACMLKRWDSQLLTKPESSQQDAVPLFQVAQPTGPRVEDLIRPRLKKVSYDVASFVEVRTES